MAHNRIINFNTYAIHNGDGWGLIKMRFKDIHFKWDTQDTNCGGWKIEKFSVIFVVVETFYGFEMLNISRQ